MPLCILAMYCEELTATWCQVTLLKLRSVTLASLETMWLPKSRSDDLILRQYTFDAIPRSDFSARRNPLSFERGF